MTDQNQIMMLHVKTNKVGSEQQVSLGVRKDDWDDMSDSEKDELINQVVWEMIDVWVTP